MSRGLVLGKFMPPHAGHVYLCEFARAWCTDLTIVVGSLAAEPIAGSLRYAWMKELFPAERVVHLTDENPQAPAEHPDFWAIWHASLSRIAPGALDYVFASDAYGAKLADVMGARFIAVDPARQIMPISGTAIRERPLAHWSYLPRCVRPHFTKRVSIIGPESTGKTTLARALASTFQTVWVPEWARTVLEARGGALAGLDYSAIVRGQIASEDSLARDANKVLICDTDPLATRVWEETLTGSRITDVHQTSHTRRYDLTLLTAPDVPWIDDGVRYLPNGGQAFFEACKVALDEAGRSYVVIDGSWEQRQLRAERACAIVLSH